MGRRIEGQYLILLKDLLESGVHKKDRTGTGTISLFGRQIRHNMSEGFPLLTTKKMYFKGIVTELLWFLRGDTNIKYLLDNNCHIWDGDAYKNYCKSNSNPESMMKFIDTIKNDSLRAKTWGELGPIYGKQWRDWKGFKQGLFADFENGTHDDEKQGIDQIQNLINDLKTNPDSRRLMVTAWNVADVNNGSMVLPPCHYGFQVYTRELSRDERIQIYVNQYMGGIGKPAGFEDAKLTTRNIPTRSISLMWNQRSVDTFLGLPFNIASYALLLEILAKTVGMVPEELIGNLGDVHLYSNHVDQAKEQLTRQTLSLPNLVHGKTDYFYKEMGKKLDLINHLDPIDFIIENYESHPSIKAPLSN